MSEVVAIGKEDQPFVGREKEQKEYWDLLAGKRDEPWLLVISGLGGIGKSMLLNRLYQQTLEQYGPPDTLAILLNFDAGATNAEILLQTQPDTSLRTDPLLFLNELAHLLRLHSDAQQFDVFTETLQKGRSQLAQFKEQVEQTSQSFAREHSVELPSDAKQKIRFAELEVNRQVRELVTEAFYRQVDTFQLGRLVIMLDTCELLSESESWIFSQWLMNEFLPELHSRLWRKPCFVVMAGRIVPESEVIDEYDQQHIVLSMLEESAVDAYLGKMGMSDPQLRHSIYTITHGHALSVAIIGQFYQNIGQEALQTIDTTVLQSQLQTEFDENASLELINERILNKLDNPFRDLTQFGVLLRTFTLPLLRTVFPDLLPEADAKAIFDQFIRYPYIESRGNYRYAFHELIRKVLAKNTQKNDRERWRQYHKKALDYFAAGGASSRSTDWYYHSLAYEEIRGMSDWQKAVQEARDRGDIQRVSSLLQITDDVTLNLTTLSRAVCAYEWGRLSLDRRQSLDKVLERFEEALSLYEQVKDHAEEVKRGQANVLLAMGDVQQSKVHLDQALYSYQDALEHLQHCEKRSIDVEAIVLKKIGDVQQLRGKPENLTAALESYRLALSFFQEVSNNLQAARVLKDIGDLQKQRHQLYGALEDLNAALESYESALGFFRQAKQRSLEDEAKLLEALGDVHQLRYQLSGDRQDFDTATENYQQAFGLFGDDTDARKRMKEKVEAHQQEAPLLVSQARVRKNWWPFQDRPWEHTSTIFGYLAPAPPANDPLPILPINHIPTDLSLKRARIRITLNRMRIAAYPGRGIHRLLLHFAATNHVQGGKEHVHFNSTYRVRKGELAGIHGYPIFVGLNVGDEGLSFQCRTIEVKNNQDESFLSFLESDILKAGLRLTSTAQPSIAQLSGLALGIAKSIATHRGNVSVQDFALGLDFGTSPHGGRLAEGSYLAVQIPGNQQAAWSWQDWVYHRGIDQVVMRKDPQQLIPYNYLVFSISRYEGI